MLKKLIYVCLSLALTFGVIGINNNLVQAVRAYDFTYAMNCNNYEVATVNDDGGFTNHACVGDFQTAKRKMYELGEDAVVRHGNSKSPTKIIAMVSGSAYSYGYRLGKNTININQFATSTANEKTTYVTMHREMHYLGTESYDGNGNGTIHINLTGFDGYTQLIGVDLIPTKYTAKEIPIMLGGNGTNQYTEQPFQTHIYQMEYVVEQNGNYRDLAFYWYSGWSGPSTYPTKNRHAVGPAADWMITGAKYYSYDGHTFYSDKYYKNYAGTYYNYYQFLPLRTKSNISADVLNRYLATKTNTANSKMANKGQVFIDGQNSYGVNALLVYAMACLESAYGTSDIAQDKNNLFGWNAVDSNPDDASYFETVDKGILEHMGINLRGYLDINDYRFFGTHLGNKGSGINLKYAADPYWGYKIAAIAYDIDKFANGYNGYLSDCNQYALGVINTYGVDIKAKPNGSSSTLYNSRYGATYQNNFMLTLLSEENGFYKTNTTNPLNGTSVISGKDKGLVNYDFNTNVGYIPVNYVTKQNSATINKPSGNVPTGDFVFSIDSFGWNNDKLAISGKAYRPGIIVDSENTIKHVLDLSNIYFEHTTFNLNSSANADVSTYSGDIDVSGLNVGTYRFKVNTEYGKYSEFNQGNNLSKDLKLPEEKVIGNKKFSFIVEGNNLKMVVSDYVAPTPKPEETPKPTPEIKPSINMLLNNFNYIEDSNIIDIDGIAYITGRQAVSSDDIKHQVIVMDVNTNKELKVIDMTTTKGDPIDTSDGVEYSNVYFKGSVDISEFVTDQNNNYYFKLRITSGDVVKETNLRNTFLVAKPKDKIINDKKVYMLNSSIYDYRYEIMVTNSDLDYSVINKPSKRDSLFSVENMMLKDNGTMDIQALAIIYYSDFNDPSKIKYSLELVNKDSGDVVTIDSIKSSACATNYQELLGLKFATKDACIDQNVDLNNIPDGNYVVNARVENGENIDIFEITVNIGAPIDQNLTVGDKQFNLTSKAIHNRLELSVETQSKALDTQAEDNVKETEQSVEETANADIETPTEKTE